MLTLEKMALIKYGSVGDFAKAAGKTTKSAKRLLDPAARLNTADVTLLVETLKIPAILISPLFYGTMFAAEDDLTIMAEYGWLTKHISAEKLNAFFDAGVDRVISYGR